LKNGRAQLVPGIGEWITLGLRVNGVPVDAVAPKEGGLQYTQTLSIVKGDPKHDLARKFIQWTTSPEGQVRMATKVDNKKPKEAEILRMTLTGPNVMDEYKAGRIACRQLPQKQSIDAWNDAWSEFKSM
jgi:spermidine/putrescine transport system substrate-binding protein